jgi:hypothetical protein
VGAHDFGFSSWYLGRVLTASGACATSQQEYQQLGLCAETVQPHMKNRRSVLIRKILAVVFRIELDRNG